MAKKSLRVKDSFLESINLPTEKFIPILYKYLRNEEMLDISRDLLLNRVTVGKPFDYIREVLVNKMC